MISAVLAVLALASPAFGAPVALRDDLAASGVALAGADVLVLRDQRRDGGAQLLAIPRGGGPARTLLSVDSAEPTWVNNGDLSASDQRVAVYLAIGDRRDRTVEWRVYSGPLDGAAAARAANA